MPKITEIANRVVIHIGDLWKKYEKHPEQFTFRYHDVGRPHKSIRLSVKYRDKWQTYGWSFDKDQVKKRKRKLYVYDRNALQILQGLKDKRELKGYEVVDKIK